MQSSLKTLDLSNNKIGDRGAAKLAEGIKHLTSLETLHLGLNGIADDGVVALTGGIRSLTSLKTLDLSNNKIGDKVNPICCIGIFYVNDSQAECVTSYGKWSLDKQLTRYMYNVWWLRRMPVRSCGTMQMVTRCLSGVVAPCKWLPPLLLLSGHCPNLTRGPPPQGNTWARSGVCAVARVAACVAALAVSWLTLFWMGLSCPALARRWAACVWVWAAVQGLGWGGEGGPNTVWFQ